MSTLTLKVEAEQTGLAQLKGLLEQMQSLVQSGGTVSQSLQTSSTGFTQFQQATVAAKTEVAVFEQEIKGLKSANETLSKSIKDLTQSQKEVAPATKLSAESLRTYMQIALAASTSQTALVTALREQKKEVQANLAASEKLGGITSRYASNVMALAGVQALLNSAFQKQVAIKSQILGLDNAALTSIKAETTSLRIRHAAELEGASLSDKLTAAKARNTALQDKNVQSLMREAAAIDLVNAKMAKQILNRPAQVKSDVLYAAGANTGLTGYQAETAKLEAGLAQVKAQALATGASLRKVAAEAAAAQRKVNLLYSAGASSGLAGYKAETAALETGMSQMKMQAIAAGAALRAQDAAARKAAGGTVDLRSALRGAAGAMGGLWMTYGKDVVMLASFYALARAIKDTVGATMEFNRALRSMQAVAGQTDEQIAKISEQLLNLNTIQGPRELAEGMRVMAKAGVEAQESVKGIQSIATLAMSDDASMESTTKLITRVMTVFDKAGKDIPEITDTIAYAASQSVMELGDFAEALSQTSELSTLMKIDLTQISAGFMLLADHGLQGGKGATALRTSLLRLLSPTKEAQQMLERLGFSAKHADGSLKDLREIATDFSKVMSTLTPGARIEVMSQLGDLRSMKALALIGTQAHELTNNMDELATKSQGFTKQLEEINLKSSSVQWDKMTADIERLVLKFTEFVGLDSGLAKFFSTVSQGIRSISDAASVIPELPGLTALRELATFFKDTVQQFTPPISHGNVLIPAPVRAQFAGLEAIYDYLRERKVAVDAVKSQQAEYEAAFNKLVTPLSFPTQTITSYKGFSGDSHPLATIGLGEEALSSEGKGLEQLQKTYEQEKKLREDDLAYKKQIMEAEVSLIQAKIQAKVAVSAEGYEKIKDLKERELKLELQYALSDRALLQDRMNSGGITKDVGGPELAALNNKIRLTQAQLSLETQLAEVRKEGDRLTFEAKVDALLDKRTNQYYPAALKAEYELSDRYDADIKAVQSMQIPLEGVIAQEARRAEIIAEVDKKYEHLTSQLSRQQADTAETTMEKALKRLNDEELPEYERGMARIKEKYADAIALVNEWEQKGVAAAEGNIASEQRYHDAAVALRADLKDKQETAVEQFKKEHDDMTVFWEQAMRDMQTATKDFFVSAIKGDFDNIGTAFLDMVTNMVANWAAAQLQMELWGANPSTNSGFGNGMINTGIQLASSWLGSAKGNVFTGAGISSLSGGVYSAPTYFGYDRHVTGFASGGVLGEADGYEAVVPLARTRSGKLGIEMAGGGSGPQQVVFQNKFEITIQGGGNQSGDRESAQRMADEANRMLQQQFNIFLQKQTRPGAVLNPQGV